jgi:hypothetical protein
MVNKIIYYSLDLDNPYKVCEPLYLLHILMKENFRKDFTINNDPELI